MKSLGRNVGRRLRGGQNGIRTCSAGDSCGAGAAWQRGTSWGESSPSILGNDASVPGHVVATNAQLLLMVTAMGCAAAAFHGRLRWYSIVSLCTSIGLGAVAFMFAARAPHPVLGIGERISIGAFLLWVAVLAGALWRRPASSGRSRAGNSMISRRLS